MTPAVPVAFTAIPAWRSPAAWCVLFFVCIAAVALDLWSKEWAFRTVAPQPVVLVYEQVSGNPGYSLPWHPGVTAIAPDLLDFHLVLNHGAVFGIGQGRGPLFIAFTVLAVCTALWVFGKHTSSRSHLSHIGLALVLAGGIGNMYDRVAVGATGISSLPHCKAQQSLYNLRLFSSLHDLLPFVLNYFLIVD